MIADLTGLAFCGLTRTIGGILSCGGWGRKSNWSHAPCHINYCQMLVPELCMNHGKWHMGFMSTYFSHQDSTRLTRLSVTPMLLLISCWLTLVVSWVFSFSVYHSYFVSSYSFPLSRLWCYGIRDDLLKYAAWSGCRIATQWSSNQLTPHFYKTQ